MISKFSRSEFEREYLGTWDAEPEYPESGHYVAQYVVDRYQAFDAYPRLSEMWDYIKQHLRRQVFDKIGNQLLCGTPVVIRAEYVTFDRFDTWEKVIQLRVELQKTHNMNVTIPKMEWEPITWQGQKVEVKVLCSACGNVFHESERGACKSCGAPASWSLK